VNIRSKHLGHRAAAQGLPREVPSDNTADATAGKPHGDNCDHCDATARYSNEAWLEAYDRVTAFRSRGLDPDGHQPPVPHVCVRDSTKVCNCCETCAGICRSEVPVAMFDLAAVMNAVNALLATFDLAISAPPAQSTPSNAPIPIILYCPECSERHIDVGEFATKPHHTHACQNCGLAWRPAIVDTVGVRFLPGFKDGASSSVTNASPEALDHEND